MREIDSRIRFLKSRLESAEVVDPGQVQLKSIAFGCTVEIENSEGEVKFYKIVGEDELDPSVGAISWQSPLAKALMGENKGDEVLLKKPKGEEILVVLSLKYI